MPSYQYRKSCCGDKTILRPSYLHNGISYTGKTESLYWIRDQCLTLPLIPLAVTWPYNDISVWRRVLRHVDRIAPRKTRDPECLTGMIRYRIPDTSLCHVQSTRRDHSKYYSLGIANKACLCQTPHGSRPWWEAVCIPDVFVGQLSCTAI